MSNDILFSNEVIIFFFVEVILLLVLSISIFFTISILKKWDFLSTSSLQYKLEKKSYLVTIIIYFTFFIKLFLVPFFAYTIDKLSTIIPGAMCGAGVISSNIYGESLLVLKILMIFIISSWLVLNKLDISKVNFPYFRKKFIFFIVIFCLFVMEFILDILYFINISTLSLATCCSAIYSSDSQNPLPFLLDSKSILVSFYVLYIFSFISSIKQRVYFSGIFNMLFLYISYYAILNFFGTYIYELPTHHCPFCMLQKDYYFVGYFIFISLFLGTFFGIVNLILKIFTNNTINKYYLFSKFFSSLFVFICTTYVLLYYYKNGVFL